MVERIYIEGTTTCRFVSALFHGILDFMSYFRCYVSFVENSCVFFIYTVLSFIHICYPLLFRNGVKNNVFFFFRCSSLPCYPSVTFYRYIYIVNITLTNIWIYVFYLRLKDSQIFYNYICIHIKKFIIGMFCQTQKKNVITIICK